MIGAIHRSLLFNAFHPLVCRDSYIEGIDYLGIIILAPMQGHQAEVEKVHYTISIYISCYDNLTGRFAKVGFACLGSCPISTHIDNPTIGEGFKADRRHRIAGIDAGAGFFITDPGLCSGVVSACLGFQVVVAGDEEIIISVGGCSIGVPAARVGKAGICVDIADAGIAALDIRVRKCQRAVNMRFIGGDIIPEDTV